MDYQAKFNLYEEPKIFNTVYININITDTTFEGTALYELQDVTVTIPKKTKLNTDPILDKIVQQIQNKIKKLDFGQVHSVRHKSWSAFYCFKEIIDSIIEYTDDEFRLFFRGQKGSWDLRPTILRDGPHGYTDTFRENYEEIYKSIARRFPSKVKYYPPIERDKRAANLAEIQHYGLGTPLVDITENPFIAMLFMVSGFDSGVDQPFPQIDVFFCRRNGVNLLFQDVEREETNPRIAAQKGAFLNFDRLDETLLSGHKRVPRVCLRIKYQASIINEDDQSYLPDGDEIQQTELPLEGGHRMLPLVP